MNTQLNELRRLLAEIDSLAGSVEVTGSIREARQCAEIARSKTAKAIKIVAELDTQAGLLPAAGNPKWAVGTLREAVEYLDANSLNQISSGSALHRCMRGALDAASRAQGGE